MDIAYWQSFLKQRGINSFLIQLYYKFISFFISCKFAACKNLMIGGSFQINGYKHIYINKLTTGSRFRMEAISFFRKCKFNPKIIIGENVSFGNDIHIGVVSGLTIGNNVLCASNITIMDHDHGGYSDKSTIQSSPEEPPAFRSIVSEPIVIGDNVHIGEYAIVLKGVSIGSGSIIGAGSVVTRSIPKNSIAVGNPARVVKQFDFKYNKWTNVGSSEDSRKVN